MALADLWCNTWRRVGRRLSVWWALAHARRVSRGRVALVRPRRLLVLCYGNIYRSPFAAAVLRQLLKADPSAEVRSAGFHPRTGRATPQDFLIITGGYQINLESHRSTLIDRNTADWADAIVVMDRHNWDALWQLGADAQAKAIWLGAFLENGSVEIIDPYGREPAEMQRIAAQLHRAAQGLGAALK